MAVRRSNRDRIAYGYQQSQPTRRSIVFLKTAVETSISSTRNSSGRISGPSRSTRSRRAAIRSIERSSENSESPAAKLQESEKNRTCSDTVTALSNLPLWISTRPPPNRLNLSAVVACRSYTPSEYTHRVWALNIIAGSTDNLVNPFSVVVVKGVQRQPIRAVKGALITLGMWVAKVANIRFENE
ncbi:hypothetical protein AYI68_g6547 [Smittium mucronatum]|uniref:Uncharacterized protein n=1 Tax=Smittium mucronatum TaxID=133383 RepID=A0A1R0GRB5_9FUNG|nr:hypothetical protein AYI68_g6547 [Smittium mucronatum]